MRFSEQEVREHIEKRSIAEHRYHRFIGYFVHFFGQQWRAPSKEELLSQIMNYNFQKCLMFNRCQELFNDGLHDWCYNTEWAEHRCDLLKDELRRKRYVDT